MPDFGEFTALKELIDKFVPIGVAVAVSVFLFNAVRAWRDERRTRRQIVQCLHDEITRNLADLEQFTDQAKQPLIDALAASRSVIPLLRVSADAYFYRLYARDLHVLQTAVFRALVEFYTTLDSLRIAMDAINSRAYPTISDRARRMAIDDIWRYAALARTGGVTALTEMKNTYSSIVDELRR